MIDNFLQTQIKDGFEYLVELLSKAKIGVVDKQTCRHYLIQIEELIEGKPIKDTYREADLIKEIKRSLELNYAYQLADYYRHDEILLTGCRYERNGKDFFKIVILVTDTTVVIRCVDRKNRSLATVVPRIQGQTIAEAGHAISQLIDELSGIRPA